MPSPVQIAPSGDLFAQQGSMPVVIGVNLYVIINQPSGGNLTGEMWKSTDAGLTWAHMDAAGEQTSDGNGYFSLASDGTTIWAGYTTTSNFMAIVPYDPGTDTWGAPVVSTNAGQSQYSTLYRASDSTVVFLAQAFQTPSIEGRPGVMLFDTVANTFTSFVQTAGTVGNDGTGWSIVGIAPGPGSTVYFFYVRSPDSGTSGTSELIVQPFTGTTPGATTIIDSAASPISQGPFWLGVFGNGSELVVGWQPNIFADPDVLVVWKSPTGAFTWVSQTFTQAGAVQNWSYSIDNGGTIELLINYQNGAAFPTDQFQDSGTGFGAALNVITDIDTFGMTQQTVNSSTPGWGLVFGQSAGIYFLASAGVSPVVITFKQIDAGVQVAVLPSIGAVCQFARPRKYMNASRILQTGKALTYPETYVP